jgi:hypothetical protein
MRSLKGIIIIIAGLCASCATLTDSTSWHVDKPFLGIELGKPFQLSGNARYAPHFLGDGNGVGSYYIDFKHNKLPFSTLKIGATPKSNLVFSIEATAEYRDRKPCRDELISRRDYIEQKLAVNFSYESDETFYAHQAMIGKIELTLMCIGSNYTEIYTKRSLLWEALKELNN